MTLLNHLDAPPAGIFSLPAHALAEALGGPTLFRLDGTRAGAPLFVSTLLHGNETSGWTALCRLMQDPPESMRPLIVFIGNPAAASRRVRHLPEEPDFNRIWCGGSAGHRALTEAVVHEATKQPLFAAVDLHNNTGRNPHYSVVTALEDRHLNLAYLFSDKAVYVEEPDTVLTRALQHHCASIAVELGPINDPRSDDLAEDLLRRAVTEADLPTTHENLTLYRSLARVHIADGVDFSFDDSPAKLRLTGGMEAVNFHAVPEHTPFGLSGEPLGHVVTVLDSSHNVVTEDFFYSTSGEIRFRRAVVPAMYTTDPEVVRQDCLCYLMTPMR